eukprot:CAMPEP_0175632600 /NCGR_PEP_ID=MMETSP0097-20121207/201_1 /TAXON_ID=311494 /ORGANISM="Alexandrium monilatum, Strain CCMP3105" /LENGTH=49 /DNA_ID= /DNA_START= /DNA_END= /DNA_ORIENTATION=
MADFTVLLVAPAMGRTARDGAAKTALAALGAHLWRSCLANILLPAHGAP